MSTISPQTALVYAMVLVSASDRRMKDEELSRIGTIVRSFPAFNAYPEGRIIEDARTCADILAEEQDGLDAVLGLMKEAVPSSHADLVYAVACDVAVADGHVSQEELRLLEMLRHRFNIDRLTAAAIERGVAARRRTFPDET